MRQQRQEFVLQPARALGSFPRFALLAQRGFEARIELDVVQRERRGIREALQDANLHGRGHVEAAQ